MPTIEITEEQRDRLENVRAELEEHRLGPYGVVRTVDAVEFLLDHYERGVGLAEDASGDGQGAADAGADPAKEAGEAEQAEDEGETGGDEEAEDEGDEEEEDETKEPQADEDETEAEDEADEEDDEETEDEEEAEDGGNEEDDEESEDDEEEDAVGDEEAEDEGAEENEDEAEKSQADEAESTPGRLNAMMQLLEEHDDKWEEDADAEGGKYAVTLPDGVTENVRTKDDVRALLFKHY